MRLWIAAAIVALAVAAALPGQPAAAAGCDDKRFEFTGSAREAEFTGGGGMFGNRSLDYAEEPVEGKLKVGQQYYVPAGGPLKLTIGGNGYRMAERGVFMVQCSIGGGASEPYLRLMEGKLSVSGPKFSGNRSKGWAGTPEGTFLPLPGRPAYTLKRTVTNSRKTTRTTVEAAGGGSNMFVTVSSVSGTKVPCQAGRSVTVFLNGKYRNG